MCTRILVAANGHYSRCRLLKKTQSDKWCGCRFGCKYTNAQQPGNRKTENVCVRISHFGFCVAAWSDRSPVFFLSSISFFRLRAKPLAAPFSNESTSIRQLRNGACTDSLTRFIIMQIRMNAVFMQPLVFSLFAGLSFVFFLFVLLTLLYLRCKLGPCLNSLWDGRITLGQFLEHQTNASD